MYTMFKITTTHTRELNNTIFITKFVIVKFLIVIHLVLADVVIKVWVYKKPIYYNIKILLYLIILRSERKHFVYL